MALETANKRRSALAQDGDVFLVGPVPDGELSNLPDMRHTAGHYRFADTFAETNTTNKRRSVFGLDGPLFVLGPVPDGALNTHADRRHVAGHYRFTDALPGDGWTLPARDLAWSLGARDLAWTLPERT